MKDLFEIPDSKKIRVIIDTDAACEADDPFAIVQALLSPKMIIKGIAAEHFAQPGSMEKSYDEIRTILDAMDMDVPVLKGQTGPLPAAGDAAAGSAADNPAVGVENADAASSDTGVSDARVSDAAAFIVSEANTEDEKPLFVLCQGAITNVAMALRTDPSIINKMTVIWIGTHGTNYDNTPFREFNAGNDVQAANEVLSSGANLWLVPSYVYTTVNIGIAEIKRRIAPCGKIGEHLYTNLFDYNNSEGAFWTKGESWSLGDSPAIAIALNPDCGRFEMANAPHVEDDTLSVRCQDNPVIRIYKDVDSRYILEDLIAKLELFGDQTLDIT